jgi:hypothetical protein
MKFTKEIIINLPLEKVMELMKDTSNLREWQAGLLSYETFEGKQGEVGAKSKLKFKNMEMIETVTKSNPPKEFNATYEAPGVFNIVENSFEKIDTNRTKYISYNEFKFTNTMMKVIGFLMPWMFRKGCEDILKAFKKFAESRA